MVPTGTSTLILEPELDVGVGREEGNRNRLPFASISRYTRAVVFPWLVRYASCCLGALPWLVRYASCCSGALLHSCMFSVFFVSFNGPVVSIGPVVSSCYFYLRAASSWHYCNPSPLRLFSNPLLGCHPSSFFRSLLCLVSKTFLLLFYCIFGVVDLSILEESISLCSFLRESFLRSQPERNLCPTHRGNCCSRRFFFQTFQSRPPRSLLLKCFALLPLRLSNESLDTHETNASSSIALMRPTEPSP